MMKKRKKKKSRKFETFYELFTLKYWRSLVVNSEYTIITYLNSYCVHTRESANVPK